MTFSVASRDLRFGPVIDVFECATGVMLATNANIRTGVHDVECVHCPRKARVTNRFDTGSNAMKHCIPRMCMRQKGYREVRRRELQKGIERGGRQPRLERATEPIDPKHMNRH